MAETQPSENEPLINNLVGSLTVSTFVHISTDVPKELTEPPEDGKVPMFICIGPKLQLKRVFKLYYFVLIFLLYRFYYNNAGKLATTILKLTFFPNESNSSNSGDPFNYDHPNLNFLLQMFEFVIPAYLSLIFAFASDYAKYQRAYFLNYSLGISAFAAFVITICGYVLSVREFVATPLIQVLDTIGLPLHKILSVLGLVSFDIGLAMFLPISLAYGLDILQGTKWKVAYFYFPLMYFTNNIGSIFSYLEYLDAPSINLNHNSMVCLVVVIIAWIIFIIGRGCRILPDYQLASESNFTICEGIKIFFYALKKKLTESKSPRGKWFIQLASVEHYGKYSHENVHKVSTFFRINFCLMLLVLIFSAVQVLLIVFPLQGYTLTIPSLAVNPSDVYCKRQTKPYLDNLSFIRNFSIIICLPFLEFFFWNVSFYYKDFTEPKIFINLRRSNSYKNIEKVIREYFHPFDPILKKIFWGLFFGLASIGCALLVEVVRLGTLPYNQNMIDCTHFGFNHTYRISGVSVFSQIPQYAIGSLLEVLSLVGIQQFIYFQCFTTFQNSYKGFFLGLYYSYLSLGIMIANITYSLLDRLCQKKYGCKYCFIYNDSCSDSDFKLTTVIWAVLIMIYLVIIIFFGIFSHYRHFQNKRMHRRGEGFHIKFADKKVTDG